MYKYKNIVVCGDIGTGTTTLAKALTDKLGWQYLSTGSFFRDYHKRNGIPLWDKMRVPEEIEKKVDLEMKVKIQNGNGLVIEGHYLGWFTKNLPEVLRILLVCDGDTATQRVLSRNNPEDGDAVQIGARRRTLREKFKKLYSEDDYEDPKFFHLVIDTTKNSIEQTFDRAFEKFNHN